MRTKKRSKLCRECAFCLEVDCQAAGNPTGVACHICVGRLEAQVEADERKAKKKARAKR